MKYAPTHKRVVRGKRVHETAEDYLERLVGILATKEGAPER